MKREKILEAMLVIATGMLVIYLITRRPVFLYISVAAGAAGILFKSLAGWIAFLWYKTGDLLGNIVSKIVLTLVFFLLLVPIAFFYRLFHKDPLRLKKTDGSNWTLRGHDYTGDDLKNIW